MRLSVKGDTPSKKESCVPKYCNNIHQAIIYWRVSPSSVLGIIHCERVCFSCCVCTVSIAAITYKTDFHRNQFIFDGDSVLMKFIFHSVPNYGKMTNHLSANENKKHIFDIMRTLFSTPLLSFDTLYRIQCDKCIKKQHTLTQFRCDLGENQHCCAETVLSHYK